MKNPVFYLILASGLVVFSCETPSQAAKTAKESQASQTVKQGLSNYAPFRLTASLEHLTENQRKMIPLLIEAAEIMDELFWYEAYGDRETLMTRYQDSSVLTFLKINYGPWDRLDNNRPFLDGFTTKPAGANFYPKDMTKEEFESSTLAGKTDLYNFIRRDESGQLVTVPYREQFAPQVQRVAELLNQASGLADEPGLQKYLALRAQAMLTDEYRPSDLAWLEMKDNPIDVVIGPIETYEDQLFGYKAAHECFILIKDMEWSERLARYAKFLPALQQNLPVPASYKAEKPGTDTELNAYDVIYYAGDCNAGSKTIAINLPNDEEVQLEKGTRRLQLKNAMRAKFDLILKPIAEVLIDPEQAKQINFNAFFSNTMFHEVAHGLGIKRTVDGKSTVRKALKEHASTIEEGKADILGLFMINQLHEKGEIEGDLNAYYVTFMASIFRSIRFGAASAHGRANMVRFNFLRNAGAFLRDDESGRYSIDFERFAVATDELTQVLLTLQGDGDYEATSKMIKEMGVIEPSLQEDLNRLTVKNIPVDIVFQQGLTQMQF